jgi:putative transposase
VVVDTLGMILAVVVHSAAVQDRDGALAVLAKLLPHGLFPRLELIWADGGYAGRLVRLLDRWRRSLGWALQIVKRTDDLKGFVVLPKRWIVERTFGWLGRYRRLSKDYEEQTRNSETMIRLAMINLMLHRLAPG